MAETTHTAELQVHTIQARLRVNIKATGEERGTKSVAKGLAVKPGRYTAVLHDI